MAALERLIYASRATRPTDSLLNLSEILAVSHRNNQRDGLTGALAVHQGRFIQVIEGGRDALDGLLNRLRSDERHSDIEVLDRRPVTARTFTDWTMGSARITPELDQALSTLMADSGVSPERTVALMKAAV